MIIGLTGGIASGKTTASQYLAQKGLAIIDADTIAREVVALGTPGLEAIRGAFGPAFFTEDGTLNRKALGKYVFSDPVALETLNNITHPLILQSVEQKLAEIRCQETHPWGILDAALFFELCLQRYVDEVWLLDVDRDVQIERLCARDGMSAEEAEKRVGSQMSIERKRKLADRILHNNGAPEALYAQLDRYLREHHWEA